MNKTPLKAEEIYANCEKCGTSFLQYRATHRYCKSPECQNARRADRWSEWRDRRVEDGTFRDKANEYQRKYRQRTGYTRNWELQTRYGITLDTWIDMVEAVNGLCEICGKADEALCVDHCHESGKIRGVLCRKCNRALGQFGDSHEIIQKVLDYLQKSEG